MNAVRGRPVTSRILRKEVRVRRQRLPEHSGLAATKPEVLRALSHIFWEAVRLRYRPWAKGVGLASSMRSPRAVLDDVDERPLQTAVVDDSKCAVMFDLEGPATPRGVRGPLPA